MTAPVFVVLINYKGCRDTLSCLASLRQLRGPTAHLVVVDNGSGDGSAEALRAERDVAVIALGENRGFAGGCNVGMQHAFDEGADYVWLLNNDTIVRPDTLDHLLRAARSRPEIDFIGSWIVHEADPGRLWFGGGTYRWLTGSMQHDDYGREVDGHPQRGDVRETDWISGCSVLVSPRTIARHGYLNEDLFLYREDVAWQLAGSRRKPRAMVVCEPLVRHKVGASTGTSEGRLGVAFMSRNYIKIALRHAGLALPLWMASWTWTAIVRPARHRDWEMLRAALLGVRHLRTPGHRLAAMISEGVSR